MAIEVSFEKFDAIASGDHNAGQRPPRPAKEKKPADAPKPDAAKKAE